MSTQPAQKASVRVDEFESAVSTPTCLLASPDAYFYVEYCFNLELEPHAAWTSRRPLLLSTLQIAETSPASTLQFMSTCTRGCWCNLTCVRACSCVRA
eukprot:2148509-Pleurochrysis_carterae.AAC.2